MIKMKYSEVSSYSFQSAMQKLANAPVSGEVAYKISKLFKPLKEVKEQIATEYRKDILEVFAKRDAEGKYDERKFEPMEDKMEEFKKTQNAFGDKETTIEARKLSLPEIKDVKLTAYEMEALAPLVEEKPPLKAVQ